MASLVNIRARLRQKSLWARLIQRLDLHRRLLRASIKWQNAATIRDMGHRRADFPALNPTPRRICKICGDRAEIVGSVDFNKSCETTMGIHLSALSIPVIYSACPSCRFIFTEDFDLWTHENFRDFIYNAEYKIVDPDYTYIRPRWTSKKLTHVLHQFPDLQILDFGGGSGFLTRQLAQSGFRKVTMYDPFTPGHTTLPGTKFDLVTCFETFEHVPNPRDTLNRVMSCLKTDGAIIFSTFLRGREFEKQGLDWWYVAPRNGHISIFSAEALGITLAGLSVSSSPVDSTMHIAWRGRPGFFTKDLCAYFNIGQSKGGFVSLQQAPIRPPQISRQEPPPFESVKTG
jgi:2-polyprenyl-6-hydroxyphenyl methylase/3-demethylubiquinone-9 3-methyltransferase